MRVIAFNLFFYGFTFASAFLAFFVALFASQKTVHRLLRFWGKTVLCAMAVILRSRVEVRGLENVPPGGPALIVSKHQSELDIVMLTALFPNCGAVAMAELAKYPFFGPLLRKLDMVLVAVDSGPQGRTQQVVEGAKRIRAQGRPMYIYPEGELMKLGAKERYRRGVGHIYAALGEPATPVAASLGAVWPQRAWRKRVGLTGAIEFLPPIPPGMAIDDFMVEIEDRIETASIRLIREHAKGDDLAEAEDRFARGVNNFDQVVKVAGKT